METIFLDFIASSPLNMTPSPTKTICMICVFYFSSPNRGDTLDRNIDEENLTRRDFLILVSH